MENFFALYDALAVWGLNNDVASFDTEWSELACIGLRLLCGCIDAGRLGLVAMASAKLHNLIHSRDPSSTEEVCYLLDSLHKAVCASINGKLVEFFCSAFGKSCNFMVKSPEEKLKKIWILDSI